jgi:hypothetical protein
MKTKHILILLFVFISFNTFAQSESKSHIRKFTIYAGIGPNYYFNNLTLGKKYVNELNYSIVGRIMWEPEHNLSLGFESGYNRLYTIKENFDTTGSLHIVNSAIPIQIVVCMKFTENIYANFTMGQSILQNKVSTSDFGAFNANSVSLGDFSGGIGYKKRIKDRYFICAEAKYFTSSKLQDKNMALIFLGGYSF